MADVSRLTAAGRLGPCSAKSNGIHMLAWPDSHYLLLIWITRPGTPWSSVELLPTDTVDELSESELLDNGSVTLLSNLTTGSITDDGNCSASWASPKVRHEHLRQAWQEAQILGAQADGGIALLDGACPQPRKVKAGACDLE